MTDDLRGRVVVVTGGSMGIGLEVSQTLAERGTRIFAIARGITELEAAIAELPGEGHGCLSLDVSDADAWSAALPAIDQLGTIHGLVTAAGVLGPIGTLDEVPPEQFGRTIAVNLLGTMLALHHLLPRLRRSEGRAVTFSGGGGTSPLPRYDAYAASKAAVVRLTENVAAERPGGVEINCLAPGFVATRMHEGTLAAGPEAAGPGYHERTRSELAAGGFPAREAAELVCFLLSRESLGISGKLLSAQWDPWREEDFRRQLRERRDLGVLRRIDDQQFAQIA